MNNGVHRPGIVYNDWSAINFTFLLSRRFFLQNGRANLGDGMTTKSASFVRLSVSYVCAAKWT